MLFSSLNCGSSLGLLQLSGPSTPSLEPSLDSDEHEDSVQVEQEDEEELLLLLEGALLLFLLKFGQLVAMPPGRRVVSACS